MASVLVLYPGTVSFRQEQVQTHAPMLEALGLQLVLAHDGFVESDRRFFDDVIEMPPPEDVVGGLRAVEKWLGAHAIDAVLAQSEDALPLGALVARKLGLPGITPEAALLTTNKYSCRERLAAAQVPQPRFALVSSAAGARAFAREVGYPVVLKGVASALGRLVTLVDGEGELDGKVARLLAALPRSADIRRLADFARAGDLDLGCDPRREFLVEAFARGAPVETDGLMVGDDVLLFGVTEQALSPPPIFYMEGYLLPADRPRNELEAIERTSAAALVALGVTNAGFSVEMRLERGAASIIEVNGRLGWDEGFGDLFAAVTGAQPAFLALQLALGARPEFVRRPDVASALAYRSHYADGIVTRVSGPQELAAIEAAHDVRVGLVLHPGARLFAPPNPDVSPHLAWALATDPRSSRAAYARARAAVAEIVVDVAPRDSRAD